MKFMKIHMIFKDSFIIKYGEVYCWISYYRSIEGFVNLTVSGYLNINDILKNF